MHKLRSLLTTLKIIFNIYSIITMLAIGEDASFETQKQIKNLNNQNIILHNIKPPKNPNQKNSTSQVITYNLKNINLTQIKNTFPNLNQIIPIRKIQQKVHYHNQTLNTQILTTSHNQTTHL